MQNVKTYQEYFSRKSLEYRAILIIPDKSNFPITTIEKGKNQQLKICKIFLCC